MLDINIVEGILIGVIGLLILFNIYLTFNKIENDTVNYIIKNWAYKHYFFITFVWGVLGGHFFLGSEKPVFGNSWWQPIVLVILIIIGLIYLGKRLEIKPKVKRRYQFVLLVAGLLYGHFFWSQRHIPEVDFPWETISTL